jgi:hypothetical protein
MRAASRPISTPRRRHECRRCTRGRVMPQTFPTKADSSYVLKQRRIFPYRNDSPAVEQAARPAMPAVPPAGLPAWRAGLRAPRVWLRLCCTKGRTPHQKFAALRVGAYATSSQRARRKAVGRKSERDPWRPPPPRSSARGRAHNLCIFCSSSAAPTPSPMRVFRGLFNRNMYLHFVQHLPAAL